MKIVLAESSSGDSALIMGTPFDIWCKRSTGWVTPWLPPSWWPLNQWSWWPPEPLPINDNRYHRTLDLVSKERSSPGRTVSLLVNRSCYGWHTLIPGSVM